MFILELQCNQIDIERKFTYYLNKTYDMFWLLNYNFQNIIFVSKLWVGELLLTIDLRTILNCSIRRVFAIFQILSYSTYNNLLFPGAGTHKEIGLLQ